MKVNLTDTLELDDAAGLRRTSDGYLVASPRFARTGIQLYRGSEMGRPDLSTVRVFRSEDAVFDKASMASMAYKPITDDHPPEQVNDKNWKKYAAGMSGGDVARDGEFLRIPMMISDGGLIDKVAKGKAELSVGYTCDIDWKSGQTPKGEAYDAVMTDIRGNHHAVVDAARGGDKLRIGDAGMEGGVRVNSSLLVQAMQAITKGAVNKTDALKDGTALAIVKDGSKPYPFIKDGVVYEQALRQVLTDAAIAGDADISSAAASMLRSIGEVSPPTRQHEEKIMSDTKVTKPIVVDGITVETTDVGAQIIEKHIKTLSDSAADLTKKLSDANTAHTTAIAAKDTQIATLTTEGATKDAKIATLETQIKDGAMTPQKLDQLVADRAVVAGKAKAILGDKAVVDGKTDHEIRKQVVDAKLGDKAKDWNEAQIAASFDSLTADVKASAVNDTARAFSTAPVVDSAKVEQAYDARDKKLEDAWKTPAAGQA